MFVIEDDIHGEIQEEQFATLQDALAELERMTQIPWDEHPNRAPCQSWRTCGRTYAVIEYDDSYSPWKELNRTYMLKISSEGVVWRDQKEWHLGISG